MKSELCKPESWSAAPSPREERVGRGSGRGASNKIGLLSPPLSSCGEGEGVDVLCPGGVCSKMRPEQSRPPTPPCIRASDFFTVACFVIRSSSLSIPSGRVDKVRAELIHVAAVLPLIVQQDVFRH